MGSIYQRGGTYWIQYYTETGRKRESTNIKVSREGRRKAELYLKKRENDDEFKETYYKVNRKINIRNGFNEYIEYKQPKVNTVKSYKEAIELLIEACGDKDLIYYTDKDYHKILMLFTKKNYSQNSKGIYTSSLHAIFEYFKESGYIKTNIIKIIPRKINPPQIIDDEALNVILGYLLKNNFNQYAIILFMLISGVRKSTVVELRWENINWERSLIEMPNIKRDRIYLFPLTEHIKQLLTKMGIKKEGKIFNYSIDGIKFYPRAQKKLIAMGLIDRTYTLHQLRKTFITKLLEQNIPIHVVKELADHKDIKTTLNFYTAINRAKIKKELDEMNIFEGIMGNEKRISA